MARLTNSLVQVDLTLFLYTLLGLGREKVVRGQIRAILNELADLAKTL
jgi:hypothetical protein